MSNDKVTTFFKFITEHIPFAYYYYYYYYYFRIKAVKLQTERRLQQPTVLNT